MALVTKSGHGMGWKRRTGRPPFPTLIPVTAPDAALPVTVDLRHQFLPAFDQGQLSTCTCNSIADIVEHELLRQHVTVPYHRSRLFPYYYSGVLEGDTGDDGRYLDDVLHAVEQYGTPPEKDWPYDPTLIGVEPSAAAQQAALPRRVTKASQIPVDLVALKTAVANGYACMIAVPVFESFESQQVASTGVVPLPSPGEPLYGYHCMTVAGYTDVAIAGVPAGYLIVLNSWGTFGLNGYVLLPYAWIGGFATGAALTTELIAIEVVS